MTTWTRSPPRPPVGADVAARLDDRVADRHAEVARRADPIVAPRDEAAGHRVLREVRDGSTRRCRGSCRSASPAGTPSRSGRGRPRRSASGTARRGGTSGARRRRDEDDDDPQVQPVEAPARLVAVERLDRSGRIGRAVTSGAATPTARPRRGSALVQVGIATAGGGEGRSGRGDRRRAGPPPARRPSRPGRSSSPPPSMADRLASVGPGPMSAGHHPPSSSGAAAQPRPASSRRERREGAVAELERTPRATERGSAGRST